MPAPYRSTGEPSRTVIGAVTATTPAQTKKPWPKLVTYGVPMAGIMLVYYWYKR